MPNKQRLSVRKTPRADTRARRTTTALARALIELIQEDGGRFEDITVREILERARVGRTTFYSHFRSKEDVLHSTYEGVFAAFKALVEHDTRAAPRLFPVREFAEHVAQARPVMAAFRRAGLADDMKSQFVGYAAEIIESRMKDLQLEPAVRPRLAARMLAAALIESIDWWVDHEFVAPAEIDTAFHAIAQSLTVRRYRGLGRSS
jgi:AcrR family transcriptional regulator